MRVQLLSLKIPQTICGERHAIIYVINSIGPMRWIDVKINQSRYNLTIIYALF